jgi:FkbM family methyltransferase
MASPRLGPGTETASVGSPALAPWIQHFQIPISARQAAPPIDVGANRGVFAYALTDIANCVVAFEPNPDYAFFARWMLRGRAEVHEVALSEESGRGTLYVPLSDQGMVLHLAGSLKRTHFQLGGRCWRQRRTVPHHREARLQQGRVIS